MMETKPAVPAGLFDAFAAQARVLLAATAPNFDLKTLADQGRAAGLFSEAEAEQAGLFCNFPAWLRSRLTPEPIRSGGEEQATELLPAQPFDLAPPRGAQLSGSLLAGFKPTRVWSPPILQINGQNSVHHVANFRRISWNSKGVIANMSDPRGEAFLPFLQAATPVSLAGRTFLAVVEGSSIYTHWMLDTLPRLLLVAEIEGSLDNFDQFLFATVRTKFHSAGLDALGINQKRVVTRHDAGTLFSTEAFTFVGPPRLAFVAPDWLYDAVAGLFLRDFSARPQTRRIYISRNKAARRRVVNEDALAPLLERHGFETLHLEEMSISETAAAVRAASHIIAPHGAGLSNLIFAQPGARVLELHGAHLSSEYWVIANQRRLQYFGFEALTPGGVSLTPDVRQRMSFFERNGQDFVVPLEPFTSFLEAEFLGAD